MQSLLITPKKLKRFSPKKKGCKMNEIGIFEAITKINL